MDCSLRIKFYPSKFFNKAISVDIIVRVSEYTHSAILKFTLSSFEVYWLGFCRNIPRQDCSN